MERIYRIIQWIVIILATALIFYLVITEERFAGDCWRGYDVEDIISEAHKEAAKKPLK